MKLDGQVCGLQYSKQLKEIGVNAESYFFWCTDDNRTYYVDSPETYPMDAHYPPPKLIFNAYTVTELLGLLPHLYKEESIDEYNKQSTRYFPLTLVKHEGRYTAGMGTEGNGSIGFFADTAADALARLLIHCIEQKIIDLSDK